MKKASKILLTIAGIFNLLATIALFLGAIGLAIVGVLMVMGVFGEAGDMGGDAPEFIAVLATYGTIIFVYAFLCLVGAIVFLISTIIAFNGAKAKQKGVLIANIIFGFLGQEYLQIVGAILGLIALGKEQNNAPVENAEPAPAPAPAPLPEPAPAPAPVQEEPKEEAKPAPAPARKDWFCPNCGAHNEGKFCAACGTKKPE